MGRGAHPRGDVGRPLEHAAQAQDATTVWSNPAGMSRIGDSQVSGALHLITPSLKFRNESSTAAAGQGLGGNGGDAGSLAPVPNFYIVKPIDSRISMGLGVSAPWGLVTEYDAGWAGRTRLAMSWLCADRSSLESRLT